MTHARWSLSLLLVATPLAAADSPQGKPAPVAAPRSAVAVVHSASASQVSGTVRFTEKPGGVEVKVELSGLAPGKHGFHIHELGDCSAADASSAGGHFNPTTHPHAAREADQRHAGDLGNLEAGADGKVSLVFVDAKLDFTGAASIIGHAVIVHANPDDFTTQPTGNAGGRVGCGVIGWAK